MGWLKKSQGFYEAHHTGYRNDQPFSKGWPSHHRNWCANGELYADRRPLHLYINPDRDIDEGAQAVHGISSEFLAEKPVFAEIADAFLEFVGEDMLVIHNAPFDVGFLNAELARCDKPLLQDNRVSDTLMLARQKFPGAQASLDALCRRFSIDNSHRDLHGALIDADLLAGVFVELQGGRQPGLALTQDLKQQKALARKQMMRQIIYPGLR